MVRKPRIHYPGVLYHMMLRGNGGADIFMDPNSVTLTDVARYFGRNIASKSNGVRQLRERFNSDKHFEKRVIRLGNQLIHFKTSKA